MDPYYEYDPIEVMLKSNLDHSTMDMQYFMAHARNEAKTVEEIQAVREARLRLRDYEKEMDSRLPSRKRLQKLRRFTQSLIEDSKYMTVRQEHFGQVRSPLENERLNKKAREFEAANPDVDLTPMFENEKTEAARQALHKKAYASYKAFHFLKNGVKSGVALRDSELDEGKSALSAAKQRL